MKIDFSQNIYDLEEKPFLEIRRSVISGNIEGWMNTTYQAYVNNDEDTLKKQLEMIKQAIQPKDLTLKTVCVEALLEAQEENRRLSENDKEELAVLARKIYLSDSPISIDPKQADKIIGRVNRNLLYGSNPLIFIQVKEMLSLEKQEGSSK